MRPDLKSLLLVRRVVKRGQSKAARESVDQLFNEPFEPQWMKRRKIEADYEKADWLKEIEWAYRKISLSSLSRILANTDDCNYHN